jgi:hypothetical protein
LKNPTRITISLDEETKELFEKLKEKSRMSQSALLREALRFYSSNKDLLKKTENRKVETYVEMLAGGEHLILDVDHWLLFLKLLAESRSQKEFWEDHRRVARSHAEQFSKNVGTVEGVLERLEACNFYSLTKLGKNEFVLVLNSNITKKFVKTFIEEVFEGMGLKVEIKDDLAKLRVKSKSNDSIPLICISILIIRGSGQGISRTGFVKPGSAARAWQRICCFTP